ncbi:MAG: serine/threonine protein kinase, partial [bacterium]|nr:serine/threonine protein kinase [bacterium]
MRVGTDLAPGSVFAKRYCVSRRIGGGGFGSVYESKHLVTNRTCALKVLLPHLAKDQKFRDGFLRESRVTAQIQSTNIVDVLDAGIDEETDTPFIVMELLEGEDLSQRLKRKTRFTAEETAIYLAQVGLALDQTHRHSIIHRDLKPGNLFLTSGDDGGPLVKILDF